MWLCNDFEQMGLSDSIIWQFMSVHNINTRLLYPPTYVLCAPTHSSQKLEYRTPPQFHEATWSLITNSHAPINKLSPPRSHLQRPRESEVARSKSWWPTPLRFCAFEKMICWIAIDQLRRDILNLRAGKLFIHACSLLGSKPSISSLSLSLHQSISQR